jgi:hypothetical protein
VEGVTNVRVHSVEQANELVNLASARRATSSTWFYKTSSRSHAIYSFLVSMEPKTTQQDSSSTTGEDDDDDDQEEDLGAMTAKLTLVDLAGSEQIQKVGSCWFAAEGIHQYQEGFVCPRKGRVVSGGQS